MADLATIDPATLIYAAARGVAVLAIAADRARRRDLATLATDRGARAVTSVTVEEAGERLDAAGTHVVLADLRGAETDANDRLMIALAARPIGTETLVVVDEAGIDHAWARLGGGWAQLLVAPDARALDDAVTPLLAMPAGLVAEDGDEQRSRRLAQLGEEAARLARALASLSEEGRPPPAAEPRAADPVVLLAAARTMLRTRRMRDRFFDRALFADPAWDMLLDLFAARLERRRVAVSSLCIAAAVPPTTALRWIAALTERDLMRREPDPEDGRRVFIALTERAMAAMSAYLEAVQRASAQAL